MGRAPTDVMSRSSAGLGTTEFELASLWPPEARNAALQPAISAVTLASQGAAGARLSSALSSPLSSARAEGLTPLPSSSLSWCGSPLRLYVMIASSGGVPRRGGNPAMISHTGAVWHPGSRTIRGPFYPYRSF
jgi:hypothetical protein